MKKVKKIQRNGEGTIGLRSAHRILKRNKKFRKSSFGSPKLETCVHGAVPSMYNGVLDRRHKRRNAHDSMKTQ